jgi:hypothetical protein
VVYPNLTFDDLRYLSDLTHLSIHTLECCIDIVLTLLFIYAVIRAVRLKEKYWQVFYAGCLLIVAGRWIRFFGPPYAPGDFGLTVKACIYTGFALFLIGGVPYIREQRRRRAQTVVNRSEK